MALLFLCGGCSTLENLEREGTQPTRSVESVRASMTLDSPEPGEPLPEDLEIDVQAEIANGGDDAHLTFDIPSVPGGIPGPDLEFIYVDGDVYYRPLADMELLPKNKEWIVMTETQLEELGFGEYLQFFADDRFLTTMEGDPDEEIGTAVIGGVDTTEYLFQGNIDEMEEVVPISDSQESEMRALVGEELELRFWLDDEGFARQMEIPFVLPGGKNEELVALVRFFDHDEPLTIEAPPAKKVASP